MTRKLAIAVWALLLVTAATLPANAGDVLDRIVATVNGHIILQSDWDDALAYESFISGRPLGQFTVEDRKSALDRLIDQELLREQMRSPDSKPATDEEVGKRIHEVRKQYLEAESDQGWRAALARYGLTENELRERLARQIELMRLVDERLRPTVNIDAKSIESYYNQELLPQLRQSGAKEVPLAEVTPKIRELLTQQKMDQLLTAWLQSLRASSQIYSATLLPSSGGQAR
jgi:peptidyl-prolyl cis-trans isomerase SurA